MKFQNYQFLVLFLAIAQLQAHEMPLEVSMQRYENEVTSIQELAGVTNYTLALKCKQQNPIVAYVPKSFAESQDENSHRYLLPNTKLASDVLNETATVVQLGSHLEVQLFGRLLAQTAGDGLAMFVTQSKG